MRRSAISAEAGFTLMELVVVIVVLAILGSVALPRMDAVLLSGREQATRAEMEAIARAIVGENAGIDGVGTPGYESDVGSLPPDLEGLLERPAGVAAFDRFTRIGWNGPYLDGPLEEVETDAWGVSYDYDSGDRTLTSLNPADTITYEF